MQHTNKGRRRATPTQQRTPGSPEKDGGECLALLGRGSLLCTANLTAAMRFCLLILHLQMPWIQYQSSLAA